MKWLFQNFGERLRFTLRNPRYVLGSLHRELTFADERFLSTITGVPVQRVRTFLGEPIQTPEFAARLREADATFRELKIQSADLYAKKVLLQYMAIRAVSLKPSWKRELPTVFHRPTSSLRFRGTSEACCIRLASTIPNTFHSVNRSAGSCRSR